MLFKEHEWLRANPKQGYDGARKMLTTTIVNLSIVFYFLSLAQN